MYSIISYANNDSFTSFPIWISFISFFLLWVSWLGLPKLCLIIVVRVDTFVLFLTFRGNIFISSPLRMMLAVDLLNMAFITLRELSFRSIWRGFIINGHWILLKAFSASVEMIIWFLFFSLLIWCITLTDLYILKNPCIFGTNSTWSGCMVLSICCWILFAGILLRIFTSVFTSDIGL